MSTLARLPENTAEEERRMGWHTAARLAVALGVTLAAAAPPASAQTTRASEVTFAKDIVPILQRSCQACHRPNSLAPMSLITYEEVRPYARSIKQRTGLRHKQGVMPPWFIEKSIGVQGFVDDISLSEDEIDRIARWVDNGAPQGNPGDAPAPRVWSDGAEWQIGEPDLIVDAPPVTVKAVAPDWWGVIPDFPSGLKEDRYVAAIEIREINDARDKPGRHTIGGLFIFHHAQMSVTTPDGKNDLLGGWPVHEVGRNADIYDPDVGKLLKAGSFINFPTVHLHSNGKHTTARLQIGFKFHPRDYKPKYRMTGIQVGSGDLDIPGNAAGVTKVSYTTLNQPTKLLVFEPHMHATGVRMCLDAIYGTHEETLSCSGYDHSWVKTYQYLPDSAPLLPRGTILRATGYFDNTPANKNVVDPRNWSGLGHRSIDNMLIMIGQGVRLTDEQYADEVAKRRSKLRLTDGQRAPGCPGCAFAQLPKPMPRSTGDGAAPAGGGQQQ
jgi:mono/diheme cytochrome c family protein